ncbi:nitroreductase [Arthrobacter sp. B6]|uniref:nitroreductase n=1 Tax=Arthrobacter sp. B6 TaxID=1570137 RepID=UPI0008331CB2|nr:nitroreductase [Arthrobacter sp. B6]
MIQNSTADGDDECALAFRRLLSERWSCRAFLPAPVPTAVVSDMFALAQRTASWCNTQPWHVYVASGDAKRALADKLVARAQEEGESPDFPPPVEYVGVYKDRRRKSGFALYDSLSIEKSDMPGRARQLLRNFEFFDAPHVAIVTTDRNQGVYGAIDCGGYVANLVNAASSLGVATIAQAAIAMYSDVVRQFFEIPQDRLVVCAVSFGYADLDHPVNAFRTDRATLTDAVTFVEGKPPSGP